MSQVNCIVPIRIRITGSAGDLDIQALGNLVTSAVDSRLRFARQTIASRRGTEDWSVRINAPSINFMSESIAEDVRTEIERAVREAIERGINGHNLPTVSPRFLLADFQPGGPPRTAGSPKSSHKAATPKTRLTIAEGQQKAFWEALRQTVLSKDMSRPEDQKRAVSLLLELLDMVEAREILRQGLQIPTLESFVRLTILEGLYELSSRGEVVWDLILNGVGVKNDASAEHKFFQWLTKAGGREAVEYLGKKLSGKDPVLQRQAALALLYLLAKEFEPEAKKLGENFARLKKLAAKHNLWTGGPLGEESLRQLVNSEIAALIDLCAELILALEACPFEDKLSKTDITAVERFAQALKAKLSVVPGLDLHALEALDMQLAQALQAAVIVVSHTRILRDNANLLITFIGSTAGESDEVATLFQLRHEYVEVLTSALTNTRFVLSMHEVDLRYTDFAGTVAAVKRTRVLDRYGAISMVFVQAKQIQPPTLDTKDQAYLDMAKQLERIKLIAWQRLGGGSLSEVSRGEMDVSVWGLLVAMFALYASALRMTIVLALSEIGSADFRREQLTKLNQLRTELSGYFQKNELKTFSDRAETIRKSLEEIGADIKHEARRDIGIHLLITAVATLLTFGAAAIARLAMLGETLALVRTADTASAIVLLVEAGTFTVAELAGENLAFDKPVTLGGAAQSFLSNAAFFGVFRALARLTAPLAHSKTLLRFIAPHLVNLTVLSGISILMTRLQTGQWPQDIGQFLLISVASYAIIAGLGAAAQKLATPAIQGRVNALVEKLDKENTALFIRYKHAVESHTLTEPDFNIMRNRKLELNKGARELAQFLRQEGLITEEHFRSIDEHLQAEDNIAKSARERFIRALPSPEDIPGLTRLGDSDVYRFDPSHPPDLSSMLSRFEVSGYRVQRYPAGLIRVLTGGGRTVFLLEAGPPVPGLLPLLPPPPPASRAPAAVLTPQDIFLTKVTGALSSTDLAAVKADLKKINSELLTILDAEFETPVAQEALGLFVEQRSNLQTRWNHDAVRGLATMLLPERGISRSSVRRLFLARSSAEVAGTFEKYLQIADRPGANFLVDAVLAPSRSVKLIEAYDAIRRARLKLPDGMTNDAVRGLLRWAEETGAPDAVARKLLAIDPDKRLARLVADGRGNDPSLGPPSQVEQTLRRHAQDTRPGLNLLQGKAADVMQAVDALAQKHGGGFADPTVRARFVDQVTRYRELIANVQAGNKDKGNLEGVRDELEAVVVVFEMGGSVFSLGPSSKLTEVRINPSHYPPPGVKLVNFPTDILLQLDVGARKVDGKLMVIETTTVRLSLPGFLQFLDPQSGVPPTDIDYNNFNPTRNPDHRKWLQFLKLRAGAMFARDLAKGLGHASVDLPEFVYRGESTAAAKRALIDLGFTVID